MDSRGLASAWASPLFRLGAIALAAGAGALVFVATGLPVAGSYRAMWEGAVGSSGAIAQTLVTATPLILTGLSVALARRAGLWNLGGEGQLYMGAAVAAAVALWYPNVPRLFLIPAMLAAGAIGGGAWAVGPALLKAGLRVNEAITTLVLNFLAVVLVAYILHGPWRDPLALGFPISRELSPNAAMPALFRTSVHAGILVAVAAGFLLWLLLSRGWWPFGDGPVGPLQEPGHGSSPAGGGIVLVMAACGALAGVAGMGEVSGVVHRLSTDVSANYGYVGILVAALGRFSPLAVLVLAVPFGALLVGGFALRNAGASAWEVAILQAVIVAAVLASELLSRFQVHWAGTERSDPDR